MRVDVIPIKELTQKIQADWLQVQASNASFSGPCFHPELFVTVGKSTPDIYVAIIYEENNFVAFIPFLKDKKNKIAKSIDFCDYEAIISPQCRHWNIGKILKKIGLREWEFEAIASPENIQFKSESSNIYCSPRIDLTSGFKNYLIVLKERKIELDSLVVKRKELERKIGPMRFIPICNEINVLQRLLDWKIARYKPSPSWIKLAKEVLENLFYLNNNSFSGILCCLYAGDELLAGQFCLRFQGVLHAVTPSFNPAFSKYSPGKLLMMNLIEELPALQCNIFDLGPHEERYKWDYANSKFPVLRGTFKAGTLKEKIKSISWIYQGLQPALKIKRCIVAKINK